MKQEITKIFDIRLVKPAEPEWEVPGVFETWKDGTLRLNVDWYKLDALTG